MRVRGDTYEILGFADILQEKQQNNLENIDLIK